MSIRIALAAAGLGLALAAAPAGATIHEYCFWDGSFSHNAAGAKCFQSGDNYLVENYAYFPYGPNGATIYCSANQNGTQYLGAASGPADCRHTYPGNVLLKAWEYATASSWTHGVITY